MSIFFGPLTAFEGLGAMNAELRFDAFASAGAQAGVASLLVPFAFDGATARSAGAVERVVSMTADFIFPTEASGGYFRTSEEEIELRHSTFALAGSVNGYMSADLGFVVEAVGPPPVFEVVGDVALRTVAYGIIGIAAESATEAFTLGGTQRVDLSILVDQPLRLRSPSTGQLDAARAVADEVRFGKAIQLTYRLLLSEGLLLAETPAERYEAVARTVDALLLSGAATTLSEATSAVVAAVMFGLQTDDRAKVLAADTLLLGDSFEARLQNANAIVEGLLAGVSATPRAVLATALTDALWLGGVPATAAQAISSLREALGVGLRIALDDGEYVAWSLNTGSKHLSRYEQFPVNSFGVIDGRLYGALDDGIYLLEGADDDGEPVNARVRFALTSMGTGKQKRVSTAYLGYTATNDLLLKVIHTDEYDAKQAYVYRLNAAPATEVTNGRVTLAKGVSSAYFAFELENVDGAEFRVDELSVIPMALERRVKRS